MMHQCWRLKVIYFANVTPQRGNNRLVHVRILQFNWLGGDDLPEDTDGIIISFILLA